MLPLWLALPTVRKPPNANQVANARRRAAEHFAAALERVTSRDEAWRFVRSGPRGSAPGADAYLRLAHFLKHDVPPDGASVAECRTYLALVRRFLKAGAIEEAEGKRLLGVLNQFESTLESRRPAGKGDGTR